MKSNEQKFSLTKKIILVTGGYRGLGLSFVQGFIESGATVIINGRSEANLNETVNRLRDEGYKVDAAVFDITDQQSVEQGIAEILANHHQIDVLVNNAGIQRRDKLEDMSLEAFREVIDTNLSASFLMAKAVVKPMIQRQSGKIINICSLMSDLARPTTGNYAAAKGGLKMLTRAMAAEWAPHNIQVNGIAPGYFETDLTRPLKLDPKFNEWICGRTPSQRWGDPQELQALAILLAGQGSSFINGQIITVDGGLSAVI